MLVSFAIFPSLLCNLIAFDVFKTFDDRHTELFTPKYFYIQKEQTNWKQLQNRRG
jgi:hypothetical protein